MMVTLIAARTERGVIGRNNRLPWHLPADLKRFKKLTTGHTIIMGRNTFESIGRPLPDRRSIVLTRNSRYHRDGIETVGSIEAALDLTRGEPEVFVIGGAEVFRAAFPHATRLYLTIVHADVDGDTLFPPVDPRDWELVSSEQRPADEANEFALSFETYERRREHQAIA